MITIIIIAVLTIFEAVHEGLKVRVNNWIPGVIEGSKLMFIYALPVVTLWLYEMNNWEIDEVWQYVAGVVSFRYAVFDFIYNLCAGHSIWYVGNIKLYDKVLHLTDKIGGPLFLGFTRFISLIAGVLLLLQSDGSIREAIYMGNTIGIALFVFVIVSILSMIISFIVSKFKN